MNLSRVIEVQTQGRYNYDDWVLSFRLEYSQDCASFDHIMDINGCNKVTTVWTDYMFPFIH